MDIERGSTKAPPRQLALENWLPIDGFPGYEISNLGHVRSRKFGKVRLLKGRLNTKGYGQVNLRRDSEDHYLLVHRLVVQAFIGDIPEGCQVNHCDGKKTNNNIENLEIVTPGENVRHAFDTGLQRRGEEHRLAKLTNAVVLSIYQSEQPVPVLAAMYGVTVNHIYRIRRGDAWSHITQEEVR